MDISKQEAEAEALRIATAFVASEFPDTWHWKCTDPQPDGAPSNRRRKPVVMWRVVVMSLHEDGSDAHGRSTVLVNLETKKTRWK